MPEEYTTEQMLADILAVVQDNADMIVPAALLIAAVNFVIGWFMDVLFNRLAKSYKG
jgi:hypothetical protein